MRKKELSEKKKKKKENTFVIEIEKEQEGSSGGQEAEGRKEVYEEFHKNR